MEGYLHFAEKLAEEAGKIMLDYFRSKEVGTTWKSDLTPLTIADTKINSLVARAIKENYPSHGLIGEEESIDLASDYIWVCDPIDGTTPYAHGVPVATFNLALTEKGRVVTSVVLDPFNNRLYSAIRGQGSFLGNTRLDINRTQTTHNFSRQAIDFEIWGGKFNSIFSEPTIANDVLEKLDPSQFSIFTFISIAYAAALVASGEFGAVLFSSKNPWDLAAASLIIEEAGGKVTNLFGERIEQFDMPVKGILAAAPDIHRQLLKDLLPVFRGARLT